jgi:hypothetical protein
MSTPLTFDFVIEHDTARTQLDIVSERVADLQKLYLQTQMDVQSILTELNNKKNGISYDHVLNQNIVFCDASANRIIDASNNNNIVFAISPKP